MRGNAPSVLLVDDDRAFLHSAGAQAQAKGFEVMTASTARDASLLLAQPRPLDLMLIDLMLPDGSGLDVIDQMDPSRCGDIVVVTGCPDVDSAIQAIRLRIDDYMIKPVDDVQLDALFDRASQRAGLRQEHALEQCGEMIGASPSMRRLFKLIRRIAPTDHTVLLHGESGTGKELAAQALHTLSGRRGQFVAVNCGAIPPDLLGSLLFGHERGSFTGATRDHAGFFEQAQHGTLFLDEFTEMPPPLQTYLLRVLETRSITRLGAQDHRELDVRVIAACNRDPWLAVHNGQLRHDVYYRLCDFPIALPPLRERDDDAVLLAMRFLDRLNEKYDTQCVLTDASLACIQTYDWPGNVRELQHAVQRAYLMAEDDRIDVTQEIGMRRALHGEPPAIDWTGQTLEEIERQAIEQALRHCGNDKTRAARMLGISVKTIYNKLMRYRGGKG
jgi:DNA-binding NtrC family response regulator